MINVFLGDMDKAKESARVGRREIAGVRLPTSTARRQKSQADSQHNP